MMTMNQFSIFTVTSPGYPASLDWKNIESCNRWRKRRWSWIGIEAWFIWPNVNWMKNWTMIHRHQASNQLNTSIVVVNRCVPLPNTSLIGNCSLCSSIHLIWSLPLVVIFFFLLSHARTMTPSLSIPIFFSFFVDYHRHFPWLVVRWIFMMPNKQHVPCRFFLLANISLKQWL